jgi:hypothetical protein
MLLLISVSGMELQFQSDQVAAFVRQTDGSLFSWRERYSCFRYLIYGIVSSWQSSRISIGVIKTHCSYARLFITNASTMYMRMYF